MFSLTLKVILSLFRQVKIISNKIFFAGFEFGAFAISAILLPALKECVNNEKGKFTTLSDVPQSSRNIKQSVGILTQLIVDYIAHKPGEHMPIESV